MEGIMTKTSRLALAKARQEKPKLAPAKIMPLALAEAKAQGYRYVLIAEGKQCYSNNWWLWDLIKKVKTEFRSKDPSQSVRDLALKYELGYALVWAILKGKFRMIHVDRKARELGEPPWWKRYVRSRSYLSKPDWLKEQIRKRAFGES